MEHPVDKIIFENALESHSGKVRESFVVNEKQRAIVVSDRLSAFDHIWGSVPLKGQVLNQIAAWWFEKLDGVVPHHLIEVIDPSVSLVKNATPLPVEMVVRGYLTGSTQTSAWYAYHNLDRKICGLEMPEGMHKNQAFEAAMITPTTKGNAGEHDRPISREGIINEGLVSEEIYKKAEEYTLTMFALGQKIAAEHGLILVDTKYEMGMDENGELIVIDEVHTPDSSRYWIAETYAERIANGQEPDMLDKEFVRRMLVDRGVDPTADPATYASLDVWDEEIQMAAAEKYIALFEKITGEKFVFPENLNATARIEKVLSELK